MEADERVVMRYEVSTDKNGYAIFKPVHLRDTPKESIERMNESILGGKKDGKTK